MFVSLKWLAKDISWFFFSARNIHKTKVHSLELQQIEVDHKNWFELLCNRNGHEYSCRIEIESFLCASMYEWVSVYLYKIHHVLNAFQVETLIFFTLDPFPFLSMTKHWSVSPMHIRMVKCDHEKKPKSTNESQRSRFISFSIGKRQPINHTIDVI